MIIRLLLVALLFGGGLARAELEVVDGYVRGLPPGQTVTAAFMTLRNSGEEDVVLTQARSPVAETLEFHAHEHVDGMMRMRQLEELRVPAGAAITLAPGGLHLMLIGLQRPLQEGDLVTIELCSAAGDCTSPELAVISVLNED